MVEWSDYTRFLVTLFAVLTPFAAIPIFLSLTGTSTRREQMDTARTAALTVFAVLVGAALAGDVILRALGTSLDAFRVGGGIVLLLMALSMLNAKVSGVQQTREEAIEAEQRETVGVVPLGIPLLAGPGAISTTIIQMQRGEGLLHAGIIIGCILIICLMLWVSLRLASPIGARLGRTGLNILNRLFGLLLAAIAAQILASGLLGLFPGLR
ncbi:MAG: NAAT family transporter [Alphaproteobacteria bacterium]|nr:NAAT family transporter [Alphaproteobacteria bacterium]MBU0797431.1 NAAT family transporter [Alphaproteobacteria bacterium]MBU0888550.1 NAAT family transporter [Alphaproteobacteria bacterium]MBU1813716.1 NAAT family transporter [Alphaproteobacteria bacterium]